MGRETRQIEIVHTQTLAKRSGFVKYIIPYVYAHRSHRRCAHNLTAGDAGGERNWDYRYTWLRDSTFTLQALHYLNLYWEAEEFMQFVADLEPNGDGSTAAAT
ncbi:MAG TPA: glycoside hydrolase family 15 protein [Solirubrobacteraceae bacterium]|nr:glycoside hydrolase family 15 protein [Solirubrobacteraceae bacterium]